MQNISPDEIIKNLKKAGEIYQEILSQMLQGKGQFLPRSLIDFDKSQQILVSIYKQYFSSPENFIQINSIFGEKLKSLIHNSVHRFVHAESLDPLYKPKGKDRRFKDTAWQNNIFFDFIKQYYLMSSEWLEQSLEQLELNPHLKKYSQFATKQFINALSPTNFIFSNPEILRESLQSDWQNIVRGMEKFLEDIKNSEVLSIPTNDFTAFLLGENIACSKGKIVFQNKLMQLIYYEPKKLSYTIPVLIVPPWINKYYVLDLSPNNSFVSYLVESKCQVFMISWANPDQSFKDVDFEDYLQEGLIAALEYIQSLGFEKINSIGYCIGGTLLGVGISYLKHHNKNYINSASFFATLLDYSDSGEIGMFIDENTVKALEDEMNIIGFFDGRYLANSFNLLRANDLVWSYFIDNYLLAKKPMAFDLLYWNADSTNLPLKMNSYYLRNMYLNNYLKIPGKLKMLETPIDLSKIDIPSFSVAAINDHIAPWQSLYNNMHLIGGKKIFCLSSAGHVAGIINPPPGSRYIYKLNEKLPTSSDEWLESAEEFSGSWWPYWLEWLTNRSGSLKKPKYQNAQTIEPAPGSYVKKRHYI